MVNIFFFDVSCKGSIFKYLELSLVSFIFYQ